MHRPNASSSARLAAALLGTCVLAAPIVSRADTLSLGMTYIIAHDHNTDLAQTAPTPNNAGGNGSTLTPSGLNYHTQPMHTFLLTYSLELNDHLRLEGVGGIPPQFSAKGVRNPGTLPDGRLYDGQTLLKGTAVPIIGFMEYHFRQPGQIRPYVGLGYWYTRFVRTSMTDAGNNVSGGQTRVDMKSTSGGAYVLGTAFPVTSDSSVVFAFSSPFKLTTHIRTSTQGGLVRESDADLGLAMYSLLYRLDI